MTISARGSVFTLGLVLCLVACDKDIRSVRWPEVLYVSGLTRWFLEIVE